ncbi:kinase-like domain-containing protein [Mycotypha africana]|uniref:kinase-like domain-containing protein n=1 Tax=Mycotypha africana TaxID=64632 RepID=UPI0023012A50|nr:kinase-like domain-containing protein [Mycotypha africana]KAI8990797.1 kinase-like domain-containing protein [Mycotypha africana]
MSFLNNLVDSFQSVVESVVEPSQSFSSSTASVPNITLKINGRNFRLTRLLGEGGFALVYLAEDDNKDLFAVKVIRCKTGNEVVEKAKREAIITDRFQHENIIKIVDMCLIKEEDGSKTVYIIMPFYKRGNLQDLMNSNNCQGKHLPERHLLTLFRGVCQGVLALSNYKTKTGRHIPWAHRDIKPANVLLSDDYKVPILMDFGSALPARIEILDRKIAMAEQDNAAENCSMPYRAPELFDVKVGTTLTEKVDVWSLGCTLFAMAYGESPFEMTVNQQGGALPLAVLNRQFYFPHQSHYSRQFQDLISWMLTSDPKSRPDITKVVEVLDGILTE